MSVTINVMDATTIAIIAGAGAVLLFAIFFAIFYQKEIRALFPRIKGIGRDGVALADSQSNVQDNPAIAPTLPFEKQLDSLVRSPLQIQREDSINDDLTRRGINQDTDKVKMLIRALAAVALNAEFERMSLTIYGTQLQFLVALNAALDGMKLSEVKEWYEKTVRPNQEGLGDVTFEVYFGFITRNGLASIAGENVLITPYGIEFMQYLVRTRQTHTRLN